MYRGHLTILIILIFSLSACQEKQDIIEATYIEFGSPEHENRELHFIVHINEDGMEPNTDYQVQFQIGDSPYIQQLTGVEQLEISATHTSREGTGLVTGTSVAIKNLSTIDVEELRKQIENQKEIIVHVYSHNEILASQTITEYKQFVNQHVNPEIVSELEVIDLNQNDGAVIFEKAISDAVLNEDSVILEEQPSYIFTLKEESYLLWEDFEYFVNRDDPFILYKIPKLITNEIYSFMNQE